MKLRDGLNRLLRNTRYEVVRRKEKFPGEDPLLDAAQILGPASVQLIFDIGANRGQTLLKLTRLFPAAAIHCFEPFPATFQQLQETARPFPQVKLAQIALGDSIGKVQFHLNSLSEMNSLLPLDPHPGVQQVGQTEVAQTTLENYCREHRVDAIDLLKIDVEGAELKVLRGAGHLLAGKKIRAIQLEVMASPHYVGQADFGEVWSLLRSYGYRFVSLYNLTPNDDHSLAWCDALFIA